MGDEREMFKKILRKSGMSRRKRRLAILLLVSIPLIAWTLEYILRAVIPRRVTLTVEEPAAFTEPGFNYRDLFALVRKVQRVESRQISAPKSFYSNPENKKTLMALRKSCLEQKAEINLYLAELRNRYVETPIPLKTSRRLQYNLMLVKGYIQSLDRIASFFPEKPAAPQNKKG